MTRRRCLDCGDGPAAATAATSPPARSWRPAAAWTATPSPSRPGGSATPWSKPSSVSASTAASPPASCWSAAPASPTSACARCEYRQYLQASGGRDYANEQRVRWGLPLVPRPDLDPPATQRSRPCPAGAAVRRRPARPRATTLPLGEERHDRRFGRHGTVRSPVETCPRPRSRGSRSVAATTTTRPARARTGSPGWWLGS
jgi:hypothetical protein